MSGNIRNKKRRLAGSTDISCESTVNEISHSRVIRSSDKLITFPSHVVVTPEPLSLTSSEALSSARESRSEINNSVNKGKKRKSNLPERAGDDYSDIIHCNRLSYDGKLLDALNSETSHEAMTLFTSVITFTQEGLNQALISACRRGHKLLVQKLVRDGADIEHRDEHGNTPLLICAETGFTDIVQFLVSRHANINAVNYVGNTALILSVRSAGSTNLTRFLLEQRDVDIHHENQHGHTALLRATHFMDVDTMRFLLQKSMKRKTVPTYGVFSLIRQKKEFSFHSSRSQEVRQQFKVGKTGLQDVYKILQDHLTTQTSPLQLAVKSGDTKSLDIFLDCQFSSMEEKKRFIDCAVKYVFENNRDKSGDKFSSTDVQIIQKLLQYGADVSLCDGLRLISLALESGNLQLVELFCTYCADLKNNQPSQQDPVCIAAKNVRQDVIELFLKYKADVSTSDFGKLPLYCAPSNDNTEHAKLLIQSGAKVNVKNMSENIINKKRNKKRLSRSTDISPESTVNDMSQSRVLRSSGKLVTFPSRAVFTPDPLTPTSSGALSPEMDNPSQISYSVNRGKKKSNMPERDGNDSFDIIHCDQPSCDGKLLDAINSETSREAMALLLSENSFTQEGLNQALISACRRGHKLLVQTLVRAGADIEHRDEHGNTPLLICAENGFTDIVQFLVSRHANVNAVNSVGNTALILSVRSAGSTYLTRFILEQRDVDIHHVNQLGHTALLRATQFMDVDTMRFLLQKSMKRKTFQTYGYISMIRQEKLFSFHNSRSQEVRQHFTVGKTGLRAVYRILQDHLTTQTSPLELAIKAGDTKSLDIFLDCQFSSMEEKKRFIDCALRCVLEKNRYKSGERFSSTDVTIMQKLLQYGADVNLCDEPRLICLAVESGNIQVIELLCTHGADLKRNQPNQQDPVCIAARNGRRDLIELLLKYKADVSTSDFYESPLYYALRNYHFECAELLIKSGAKMNVKCALRSAIFSQMPKYLSFVQNCNQEAMDYFSQKPLEATQLLNLAVLCGNCEIIGQILDAGVGINEADSSGQTPLMASKNAEVAEFLIQRGANVNREIKDKNGIETALSHMIGDRELSDASTVELCKVLIQNGALVNFRNGKNETPLMLAACRADCVSMLELLLENCADVNDKDSKGNTALFLAVMGQRSKNITCLIDSVRDKESLINVQNNDGLTPLIVSVQRGNVPIVKELIEQGADVNMKDNKENSALHYLMTTCPENKEEEILTSLLEAGSHVNCQNSDGLSPLMLAAEKTIVSVISPLLDAGADVNAVSKSNTSLTALSFLPDDAFCAVKNTVPCIETLMNRGANCSYLNYHYFHKLIIENRVSLIPKLIQYGLGPAVIETNIHLRRHRPARRVVSPLLVALLRGHVHLARYFVDILFLTRSDLFMIGSNKAIANSLQEAGLDDSLNLLQELSLRPMSLVKLCLVMVSTSVGPCPGRETRVDSLPLPQMMKDRLLFKSVADEHAALAAWEVLKYNDSSDDDYY